MSKRNLKRRRLICDAAISVMDLLEPRTFVAASCNMGGTTMAITGDGNANSIIIYYSSGVVTAKESGTPMANCNGVTGVTSLTAAMGAGIDLLDASALPSGIPTTLQGEG